MKSTPLRYTTYSASGHTGKTADIRRYCFSDIGEIYDLSRQLACRFPDPESVVSGVYELLLNAVEHGNLGIGYALKSMLLREGRWAEEVRQRLTQEEYATRYVEVMLKEGADEIMLVIRDQGEGFDWRRHFTRRENVPGLHGRGLLIARSCGFDTFSFNEAGNEVRVSLRLR